MTTSSRPLRLKVRAWLGALSRALTSSSSLSGRSSQHVSGNRDGAVENGGDDPVRHRQLIRDLLDDPNWVVRRVETVTILSAALRERRVSVDLDVTEIARRASDNGLVQPERVSVPISVLPKGLIFDFDARDGSGEPLSLANRSQDSELAAAVMSESALRLDPTLDDPSPAVGELLYAIAHTFPSDDFLRMLRAQDGAAVITELSSHFNVPVRQADRDWWLRAWAHSQIRSEINHYARNFISFVLIDLREPSQVVKFRRLEQASDSSRSLANGQPDASDFSLAAYDVGRAASEHLRVVAPPGTFFTDALLFRLTPGTLAYSERTAVDRLAFYTHGVEPGEHFVYAKLWPTRSGFMRPAKYLSGYGVVVLILGALADWWSADRWGPERGFLWHLSDSSDAAAALVLTLPTILVAYIVRDGEHDVRAKLLATWRALALLSLLPMWCAAITLMIDRQNLLPWTLGTTWAASGALALGLHLAIQVQDYRLRRAYRSLAQASPHTRDTVLTISPSPGVGANSSGA